MKRVRLRFGGGFVDFVNRDAAVRTIAELGERGTRFPVIIYGPEGCGKVALFKQAVEVLRELGYAVIHINPLAERIDDKVLSFRRAWEACWGARCIPPRRRLQTSGEGCRSPLHSC